jgi:hypothetical protein
MYLKSETFPQWIAGLGRLLAEARALLAERGEGDFPLILTARSFLAILPFGVLEPNKARNTIFLPGEVLYTATFGYPFKGNRRTSSLVLTFILAFAPLLMRFLIAASILKSNRHFNFKNGYDTE